MQYAGTSIPERWMKCEGQTLSRTDYSELFSVIGTAYGSGDGSTTFNLPNLEGRFPIGYKSSDTDFNMLGKKGGSKTHTQTENEIAPHTHTPYNSNAQFTAQIWAGGGIDPSNGGAGSWGGYVHSTTGSTGEGEPMDIMNPYIVLNYCIKVL